MSESKSSTASGKRLEIVIRQEFDADADAWATFSCDEHGIWRDADGEVLARNDSAFGIALARELGVARAYYSKIADRPERPASEAQVRS